MISAPVVGHHVVKPVEKKLIDEKLFALVNREGHAYARQLVR